jgi:hypothetical protein
MSKTGRPPRGEEESGEGAAAADNMQTVLRREEDGRRDPVRRIRRLICPWRWTIDEMALCRRCVTNKKKPKTPVIHTYIYMRKMKSTTKIT